MAGSTVEEELDRAKVARLAASEIADRAQEEGRLIAIAGKDAITVSFGDWNLENVPLGAVCRPRARLDRGAGANAGRSGTVGGSEPRAAPDFWAKSPTDALALKKVIEARSAAPERAPQRRRAQNSSLERSVRAGQGPEMRELSDPAAGHGLHRELEVPPPAPALGPAS